MNIDGATVGGPDVKSESAGMNIHGKGCRDKLTHGAVNISRRVFLGTTHVAGCEEEGQTESG